MFAYSRRDMSTRAALLGVGIGTAVLIGAVLARHVMAPALPSLPSAPYGGTSAAAPSPTAPQPTAPQPGVSQGADYDRCMAMLRTDPAAAASFADAWEATGGGGGARHCYALALVAQGDAEQGAQKLEALAGDSKAPAMIRATLYAQATEAWMMAHDPGRAYGSATLALALDRHQPNLYVDRSMAAAGLKRYADAVDDLNHALALAPGRADLLVYRGAAFRHLNQPARARQDIDAALRADPGNQADALLERGLLQQDTGNITGARADWRRAIEQAPNSPTADIAKHNLDLLAGAPHHH